MGSANSILFVNRLMPLIWTKVRVHSYKHIRTYVHPFDNSVYLMSSLSSFAFFAIKENSMLDLHNVSHLRKNITSKGTLLYKPLPSGSEMATMIFSFFDLRYLPTPATVPPVPTPSCSDFRMWRKDTSAHLHQKRMHLNDH